jgi:hypothetical protein
MTEWLAYLFAADVKTRWTSLRSGTWTIDDEGRIVVKWPPMCREVLSTVRYPLPELPEDAPWISVALVNLSLERPEDLSFRSCESFMDYAAMWQTIHNRILVYWRQAYQLHVEGHLNLTRFPEIDVPTRVCNTMAATTRSFVLKPGESVKCDLALYMMSHELMNLVDQATVNKIKFSNLPGIQYIAFETDFGPSRRVEEAVEITIRLKSDKNVRNKFPLGLFIRGGRPILAWSYIDGRTGRAEVKRLNQRSSEYYMIGDRHTTVNGVQKRPSYLASRNIVLLRILGRHTWDQGVDELEILVELYPPPPPSNRRYWEWEPVLINKWTNKKFVAVTIRPDIRKVSLEEALPRCFLTVRRTSVSQLIHLTSDEGNIIGYMDCPEIQDEENNSQDEDDQSRDADDQEDEHQHPDPSDGTGYEIRPATDREGSQPNSGTGGGRQRMISGASEGPPDEASGGQVKESESLPVETFPVDPVEPEVEKIRIGTNSIREAFTNWVLVHASTSPFTMQGFQKYGDIIAFLCMYDSAENSLFVYKASELEPFKLTLLPGFENAHLKKDGPHRYVADSAQLIALTITWTEPVAPSTHITVPPGAIIGRWISDGNAVVHANRSRQRLRGVYVSGPRCDTEEKENDEVFSLQPVTPMPDYMRSFDSFNAAIPRMKKPKETLLKTEIDEENRTKSIKVEKMEAVPMKSILQRAPEENFGVATKNVLFKDFEEEADCDDREQAFLRRSTREGDRSEYKSASASIGLKEKAMLMSLVDKWPKISMDATRNHFLKFEFVTFLQEITRALGAKYDISKAERDLTDIWYISIADDVKDLLAACWPLLKNLSFDTTPQPVLNCMAPQEEPTIVFKKDSLQSAVLEVVYMSSAYKSAVKQICDAIRVPLSTSIASVDDIYKIMLALSRYNSFLQGDRRLPLVGPLSYHGLMVAALNPQLKGSMQLLEAVRVDKMDEAQHAMFTLNPDAFLHLNLTQLIDLIKTASRSVPKPMDTGGHAMGGGGIKKSTSVMPVGTESVKKTAGDQEQVALMKEQIEYLKLGNKLQEENQSLLKQTSGDISEVTKMIRKSNATNEATYRLLIENEKRAIDATGQHFKFAGIGVPQSVQAPLSANDIEKRMESNRREQIKEGTPAMRTNRTEEIKEVSQQEAIIKTNGPGSINLTCNQFARTGKCTFGDKCKYLHVAPNTSDRVLRSSSPQLKGAKRVQYVNAISALSRPQDAQEVNQLFYSLCEDSSDEEGTESRDPVF